MELQGIFLMAKNYLVLFKTTTKCFFQEYMLQLRILL